MNTVTIKLAPCQLHGYAQTRRQREMILRGASAGLSDDTVSNRTRSLVRAYLGVKLARDNRGRFYWLDVPSGRPVQFVVPTRAATPIPLEAL